MEFDLGMTMGFEDEINTNPYSHRVFTRIPNLNPEAKSDFNWWGGVRFMI